MNTTDTDKIRNRDAGIHDECDCAVGASGILLVGFIFSLVF